MEKRTDANTPKFKEKFKEKFKDFKNDPKKRKEVATKYTGLYTVQLAKGDISYIGRWKSPNNKQKGITLGRKSNGMTQSSAYALRLTMIDQEKKEYIKSLGEIHEPSGASPSETNPQPKIDTLSDVFRKYLAFKKLMNGNVMTGIKTLLALLLSPYFHEADSDQNIA